ncbi:MAG TPA: T9SS type A sorting domain-containing protein [Ignavibacteria bacterium]|nr:T9SS type A sorting domain-containing protein [Ignavibacteria bacterium]HMQ99474.1 T9SS type A sorting domain-containing protein [Ignavibacteria bacterium]
MKSLLAFLILDIFLSFVLNFSSFADSPWSPSIKVSGSYLVNIEACIAVKYPNIYVSYLANSQKFAKSTDGGLTWLPETYLPGYPTGDGVMETDDLGNIHLVTVNNAGYWRIVYYRSTNEGQNWLPLTLNQSNEIADKPWIDNTGERIYVCFMSFIGQQYRVKVMKSVDRGITFSQGTIVNNGNLETFRLFPIVREDPKDSNIVYVSMFWDRRNLGSGYPPPWQVFVGKSTDGGNSWLPNVALPDTGRTALFPVDIPYQITSSMAVSPVYNDVYVVWGDSLPLPGGRPNIFFSRSTNGAASFEPRVKIPAGPVPDTSYLWQPHIECDIYGTIHLQWYDTRGFAASHAGGRKSTYYTYSTNRGVSWATEEKVSDSSEVFGNEYGTGHYHLFTTDSLRIYAVWSQLRPQYGSDVYYSWRYLPNIIGIQQNNNNLPKSFRLEQNFPNPFNPSTTITFEMPNSANVKLTIYDATGKEIEILVNGIQSAGKHEVVWDAFDFPSGIYFYKLEAENYLETKKMIIIK